MNLLYISNVHEDELYSMEDLFSTVGDVESTRFEVLSDTGYSYKFGVFTMSTAQQAFDCAERFNGHRIETRIIGVSQSRPKLPEKLDLRERTKSGAKRQPRKIKALAKGKKINV